MTQLGENPADQIATFERLELPFEQNTRACASVPAGKYTVLLKRCGPGGLWRAYGIGFALNLKLGTRDLYKARALVEALFERRVTAWRIVSDPFTAERQDAL